MPPTKTLPSMPLVTAVLVVHNGNEWLPSVLATLAAQQYPALELVVVDSGSTDEGGELLSRRIPADRLIRLPRNVGFTRAVVGALTHPAVASADALLLLHDDVVLAPDAIAHLVKALRDDTSLAIVGPKLREWSDDGVLAEVGMTIDRFGRAETRAERGELDQGQHDRVAEVLYVNSAGMLIGREVFRELGGFDTRFPAYREDLDLCWRAWLRGYRVEVVPDAVGYHIGGGRPGRTLGGGQHGGRYLAERHSVATLLKNYSPVSLLWAVPITFALALAKVLAFLLVRRFGEASAVVRAYLWNIAQLPRTLRRRRAVQRRRTVPDRSVTRLFAPGLPRMRGYLETVGAWIAGGSTRALIEEEADEDVAEDDRPVWRFVRERPAAVTGIVLAVAYLIGLAPLLGSGQVIGGEIGRWPQTAAAFLRAYIAPHNGEPLGTTGFASPIQAVIGLASFLGFGNPWLAQRVLVFGLVPVAWLLAVRAGRLITSHAGPRALGATLYVLSPAVLGALGHGRYGVMVVATLLPGLVLVGVRATDTTAPAATAWRATALLALGLATAVAAAPDLAPLAAVAVAAAAVTSARRRTPEGRAATARLGVAAAGALAVLSPWLITTLVAGRWVSTQAGTSTHLPLWRAAAASPDLLPGLTGLLGIVTALTAVAVVAASILLGLRRRPDVVAVLTTLGAATALMAWGADRLGIGWVWAPGLLLPTALAIGGLGVLAARSAGGALAQYAFGARQLSVVIATAVLGVGLLAGTLRLASGPYVELVREPELVPAFVDADAASVGRYRVMVMAEDNGVVEWDMVSGGGPSMVRFGAPVSRQLTQAFDAAVAAVAGGGDPRAGAALGVLNVRYLVLDARGVSDQLRRALADQPALEPLPSGGGRVYRVRSWLPRAAVVPPAVGARLAATGDPGDTRGLEKARLSAGTGPTYSGRVKDGGMVLLGEAGTQWRAAAGGQALDSKPVALALGDGLELPAWTLNRGGQVDVTPTGRTGHTIVVGLQGLLALALLSLALRPPGFTQRRVERARSRELPRQLTDPPPPPPTPEPDQPETPPMETNA
jgi:GT2 family glycosyltransferase